MSILGHKSTAIVLLCKTIVEMKLISEGSCGDSDGKHDEQLRHVLGLGSTDTMVVALKEIEKFYNFAAYDIKVQVDRINLPLADKLW